MLMVYAVEYLISKINKYFSQEWKIQEDTIQAEINSKFPNIAAVERIDRTISGIKQYGEASSSSSQEKPKERNIKDFFRSLEQFQKRQNHEPDLQSKEILALTRHILILLKEKAIKSLKEGQPADEVLVRESEEAIAEAKRTISLLKNQAESSIEVPGLGALSLGPSKSDIDRTLNASEFLLKNFAAFCEEIDGRRQLQPGHPCSMRDLTDENAKKGGYIVSSNIKIAEYVYRNLFKEGLKGNWRDLSKPKRDVILNNALLLVQANFSSREEALKALNNIHKLRDEGNAVASSSWGFTPQYAGYPQRFDRLCLALHMDAESEMKKQRVAVRGHGKCKF
jgi:hypothetical protein